MKVIVFSDSHGKTDAMIDIISNNNADKIIHLGDLVKDAEMLEYEYPDCEVISVAGNNDWYSNQPTECLLELEGKKVLVTHGNHYGVKNGVAKITERARKIGADIVLFGHTHIPYESYSDNILLLNPGSVSLPAGGSRCSCCLVDITSKEIKTKFLGI
ncbi:MAG: metallophosphoesterase [Deltaproteobacteria bacterium]